MKLYSVEWNCEPGFYWIVYMACVAETEQEAIKKFRAKFEKFKEEFNVPHLKFFTEMPDRGGAIPNGGVVIGHDLNYVVAFYHEE